MKSSCLLACIAGVLVSCGGGGGTASVGTTPTPQPGLSLLAGNIGGPGNIDAVGTNARFSTASLIAADTSRNVYVHDADMLRKVGPDGMISEFAGKRGSVDQIDGTGAGASFGTLSGLVSDRAGNLYVIDTRGTSLSGVLRKITPDGTVTTLPNSNQVVFSSAFNVSVSPATGLAVDSSGNLYTSSKNTIWKLAPDGQASAFAGTGSAGSADGRGVQASFTVPLVLSVDTGGNLYVNDNDVLRKITPQAVVTTIGPISRNPSTWKAGPAAVPGVSYVVSGCNVGVMDASGSVTRAAPALPDCTDASPPEALGATADAAGNVYVSGPTQVWKITPSGSASVYAGAAALAGHVDAMGAAARFRGLTDIAPDGNGNLYASDPRATLIRKIDANGVVTTLAGKDGQGGNADGTGSEATFQSPIHLTVGPSGAVYVSTQNNAMRKITPQGVVTTVRLPTGNSAGCSGGIVSDQDENLYISCRASNAIIKLSPGGVLSTPWNPGADLSPAGQFGTLNFTPLGGYIAPEHLAIDRQGNLYGINDQSAITRFTKDGRVELIPNSQSDLHRAGIAVDDNGDVYVSESVSRVDSFGNGAEQPGAVSLIRKFSPDGSSSTIAGNSQLSGTLLGPLPGSLDRPRGMRFIGPKTLAVAMPLGVIELVVP